MNPLKQVLLELPDAKQSGSGWVACCPAHEDRRASLSIAVGDDGRALVNCHAGCSTEAVVTALGLTMADLMPPREESPNRGGKAESHSQRRIVAQYDYCDESGKLLFQAVRLEPKDFRQRRPKAGGGWEWSVKGVRQVPYRLPELLAEPTRPVMVVEGEKDVENLARAGLLATCNAGGAGKWTADHAEHLRGRRVVVLSDNDEPGHKHAQQVAASLQGIAEWVRVVELPGLPPKGDVSDWLAAGGTKEELKRLIEAAPNWTPTAEPWPEIQWLDALELPSFPTHALPPVLRDWVEAESHATQTPADLAGLLALAVCSASIARRVEVEPRPGWREPVNLFVAVLLAPGNRKSGVFGNALRPLRELEAERIEEARPSVAREQSERRQAEAKLRKLEKRAAEADDSEAQYSACELAAQLAEMPTPVLPRLIVDDATSEKIGMMLEQQGGRIASMSPEGGVFDLMAGMYSKSGMPQFGVYLMGHSGDDLITDRVSRESIRVSRPALTCAYAMQPQVIEGLAENAAFRGRGLLARFLYAAPRSWIGRRKVAPEPVAESTREAYRRAVRTLAALEGEFVLQLAADAGARFRSWEAKIEVMLGDGGAMEMMCDWGSKLAGATLRLAAVLHCIEHGPETPIGRATIEAAVEIASYLIPHAEAVLNMMQAQEDATYGDAQYLLRWIEEGERREFTKRDAHQHGRRRFPRAEDIDPPLAELEKRGYIRKRAAESSGRGRPASPIYDVNPALFERAATCPQNTHNPASELMGGYSEDIEYASEQHENAARVQVTI